MANVTGCHWSEADFCLGGARSQPADLAPIVYERACRTDFLAPGFCLVNLGAELSSTAFRRFMIDLKQQLRRLHQERMGRDLILLSAARFDQQVTTKPHRDGGPEECMLLLGYEPSDIRAELRMSDYSRCAHDLGMTPDEFLEKHNPMFAAGEQMLQDYTTRVTCFCNISYQLLVVNNSVSPYSADVPRWQGVLHTAKILNPDVAVRRVVNSLMVASVPSDETEPVSAGDQEEFVRTSLVRRRGYDKLDLEDDA